MGDSDITTDQSTVRLEITLTKNEADYLVGVLAVSNDYEILEANDRGLFEPINDIKAKLENAITDCKADASISDVYISTDAAAIVKTRSDA